MRNNATGEDQPVAYPGSYKPTVEISRPIRSAFELNGKITRRSKKVAYVYFNIRITVINFI